MRRMGKSAHWLIHRSWLSKVAKENDGVRDLAYNYVAGTSIKEAKSEAEDLREKGLSLGFSYLAKRGESTSTPATLKQLVDALGATACGADLSVKASTLGMRESLPEAVAALNDLCHHAHAAGASVTLEMQHPDEYRQTLDLYREARQEHPGLGVTLPVNVRRTERECRALAQQGARIRLCIGSYPTSRNDGILNEHEKTLALVRCLRIVMESSAYPMIASHDPRVIEIAGELARRTGRGPQDYEHQMFYGVRPLEQRRLVDIGLTCRTYLPFGPAWYSYLATRIAARPRMSYNYLRALLDKR